MLPEWGDGCRCKGKNPKTFSSCSSPRLPVPVPDMDPDPETVVNYWLEEPDEVLGEFLFGRRSNDLISMTFSCSPIQVESVS